SIRAKLDKLAKLEGVAVSDPPKTPHPKLGEIGEIASFDSKYGFYVITVGTENGIKTGDIFTVFRGGSALGKIKIVRANPTLSIANHPRGFPKPPAPFVSSDKVMKLK
ncbi:MAG: hypothetical protein QF685_07400, partial [Verrucomicrobiota bacterium]|nr:hypothetical protein [Verrucomicrobiota bacterium]